MPRKKGQTLRSDGRNMVIEVLKICEQECIQKHLSLDLNKPEARAALYCNVSRKTVMQIKSEERKSLALAPDAPVKLGTPGKNRRRPRPFEEHEVNCAQIRHHIQNFYLGGTPRVPSLRKLLRVLRREIDFPYGKNILQLILHRMGFRWKECGLKRKILIEKPQNVSWRGRYIRKIGQLRAENRPIFYIDETWIDNNVTSQKCWQGEGLSRALTNTSSSNGLILVHACSESGLLKDAELLYRANATTGDYRGQMNGDLFWRWCSEKLIPNLPAGSVVVLDNAPYHSVVVDKVPRQYATKGAMCEWLSAHNIPHSSTMRKFELFNLIEVHKRPECKYVVDELLRQHGHHPLRLPPYMCELNPIELVWSQVRRRVQEMNVTGEMNSTTLQNVTRKAIDEVTPVDVRKYIQRVFDTEDDYWTKDSLLENVVDEVIMNFNSSSDDSDDDSTDDSDYVDDADPISDIDETLAERLGDSE